MGLAKVVCFLTAMTFALVTLGYRVLVKLRAGKP